MVLIILLYGIPMMLAFFLCVYIFYKGIKEKNKIKIMIPLILLVMVRGQIKNIISSILLVLYFLVILFLPYIIGIIISVILICLVRKKKVGKNQEFRNVVCIVMVICGFVSLSLAPLWYEYASARPDDTYVKMKEIDDNKSLIGLSKEQVEELLGEKRDKNKDVYYYGAGKITNYISSDNTFYVFQIYFDENDIVESTTIKTSD